MHSCIFHDQNREGEKIFKEILLAGMRRLKSNELEAYVAQVELVVNTKILNRSTVHQGEDGTWTFPLDDAREEIKEVNLTNHLAQKIIAGLEMFFPVCLVQYNTSVANMWTNTMLHYQ